MLCLASFLSVLVNLVRKSCLTLQHQQDECNNLHMQVVTESSREGPNFPSPPDSNEGPSLEGWVRGTAAASADSRMLRLQPTPPLPLSEAHANSSGPLQWPLGFTRDDTATARSGSNLTTSSSYVSLPGWPNSEQEHSPSNVLSGDPPKRAAAGAQPLPALAMSRRASQDRVGPTEPPARSNSSPDFQALEANPGLGWPRISLEGGVARGMSPERVQPRVRPPSREASDHSSKLSAAEDRGQGAATRDTWGGGADCRGMQELPAVPNALEAHGITRTQALARVGSGGPRPRASP